MTIRLIIATFLLSVTAPGHGQVILPDWETVNVKTTDLGNGLYVLEGFGGNIGVLTGPDGVLLVDDQYDQLSEKNLAAIREFSDQPIEFVINTHWHGDHAGGNAAMQALGAHIISTDETRVFLEKHNADVQATNGQQLMTLPVATFRDRMTFHLNGQEVRVLKVRPAHTAGDAVVEFQPANVIHMGDASFNGFYPFIDVVNGGSIDGMIELHREIHDWSNDHTTIVFGHGPNGNRADLLRYRAMLIMVRDRVAAALDAGMELDKLIAAKPLADLDPEWGDNLIKAPALLEMVYKDLSKNGW